jgi:hypothetical protein
MLKDILERMSPRARTHAFRGDVGFALRWVRTFSHASVATLINACQQLIAVHDWVKHGLFATNPHCGLDLCYLWSFWHSWSVSHALLVGCECLHS